MHTHVICLYQPSLRKVKCNLKEKRLKERIKFDRAKLLSNDRVYKIKVCIIHIVYLFHS